MEINTRIQPSKHSYLDEKAIVTPLQPLRRRLLLKEAESRLTYEPSLSFFASNPTDLPRFEAPCCRSVCFHPRKAGSLLLRRWINDGGDDRTFFLLLVHLFIRVQLSGRLFYRGLFFLVERSILAGYDSFCIDFLVTRKLASAR